MDTSPRIYVIKRSPQFGYGFVAGHEYPTIVKIVEPQGPSYGLLWPGDIIMEVNGINVETKSREEIISMIQHAKFDQIEIQVRQLSYEDQIRAKNLQDPKFYTLNKSASNNYSLNTLQSRNQTLPTRPSQRNLLPATSMNRLVTSISQQQYQHHNRSRQSMHSPELLVDDGKSVPPLNDIQKSKLISRRTLNSREDSNGHTNHKSGKSMDMIFRTLNRKHNYGKHSPVPQRCKSSMDVARKANENIDPATNGDDEKSNLRRCNTMRPIKHKVIEILERAVVIKIFFEDGHTRVLSYNQDTTVATILEMLNARLLGDSAESDEIKRYFGLVLKVQLKSNMKGTGGSLHVLDENDSIMKIRKLPYSSDLRLLYRMVYPPSDVSTLYMKNKVAFDYLYKQCCNDLKSDHFQPELDQETKLKLTALRLLEYVHSNFSKVHNSRDPKLYLKLVKKDPGMEFFLAHSSVKSLYDDRGKRVPAAYKRMKSKLTEQIRKNFDEFDLEPPKAKSTTITNGLSATSFHELCLPELRNSPSDHIKLLFLNYISGLSCYGNAQRPMRSSTSPIDANSAGERSSSLESVPRTSDSSPLIRRERNSSSTYNNSMTHSSGPQQPSISRLAQMNSMRSISSIQSSSTTQGVDRPDMAETPSSVSSVTFNMQTSPSPQQTPLFNNIMQQHQHQAMPNLPQKPLLPTKPTMLSYAHLDHMTAAPSNLEPAPLPRQQIAISQPTHEARTVERLYGQRIPVNRRPIEDLLKNVILLPPPPPPPALLSNGFPPLINKTDTSISRSSITRVLTDHDIEMVRVPPPPRLFSRYEY